MFDTHAVARTLTEADLTPAQADAITDAVRLAAEHDATAVDVETLATKADVAAVQADVAGVESALKADIAAVHTELKVEIADVKVEVADVKANVTALEARLGAEIAAAESRLIKWMVGIAFTLAGLLTAAGTAVFVALLRTLG